MTSTSTEGHSGSRLCKVLSLRKGCSLLVLGLVSVLTYLLSYDTYVYSEREFFTWRFFYQRYVAKIHEGISLLSTDIRLIKHDRSIITYIGTYEGLSSRLLQLEEVYKFARLYKRKLRIINTKIIHYKDTGAVDLCKIFDFPSEHVECRDFDVNLVVKTLGCNMIPANPVTETTYVGSTDRFRKYFHYENYSFKDNLCIAGYLSASPLINATLDIRYESLPLRFSAKYKNYFLNMIQSNYHFDYRRDNFTVVHWRRGDQMKSRCTGKELSDYSVNCVNDVQIFLAEVKRELNVRGISKKNNKMVYIATQERNPAIMREIDSHYLSTYKDWYSSCFFSSLDLFVLELMLMTFSSTYIAWGDSGVHYIVDHLKHQEGVLK